MKTCGDSAFLQGVHHAYAQTDGTYAWPNSREGDLLREAKREIERLRAAMLTAASLLERDGDEHSVGAALRRALNEPAHGADKPVCDMTEQLYAAKVEECGQLTVQRDYLRNILEHISGTCEGRAVVIARAALVMFPQIHNVTIKFPIEKEEL